VIRIEPSPGEVRHGAGVLAVGDVSLGGTPRGVVLLLCEPGQRAGSAARLANGLAEHGFDSTIADLGDDHDESSIVARLGALLEHVATRGWRPDQAGVVGYGPAGVAAHVAAEHLPVGAAVSLANEFAGANDSYPDGYRPRRLQVPWLGMFAVPAERMPRFARYRRDVEQASDVYTEVVAYRDASPSYYRDSTAVADHAASFDSWQRTIEWLNLRVVPRLTPLAEAWVARHPAASVA